MDKVLITFVPLLVGTALAVMLYGVAIEHPGADAFPRAVGVIAMLGGVIWGTLEFIRGAYRWITGD